MRTMQGVRTHLSHPEDHMLQLGIVAMALAPVSQVCVGCQKVSCMLLLSAYVQYTYEL